MKSITIILLLGFTISMAYGYNQNDGIKFWDYSRIAYCADSNIVSVNCGSVCNAYKSDLKDIQVISNKTKEAVSFIAYSKSENALILSFRGTSNINNWLSNLQFGKTNYSACTNCKVHSGFLEIYSILEQRIIDGLTNLANKYNTLNLIITGHSLGGAMATVAAGQLYSYFHIKKFYTFGSPRVGNAEYTQWWNNLNIQNVFRVTHNQDTVPHVPMITLGFSHVDQEIWYYESNTLNFKECKLGEDETCSNSIHFLSINDHLNYYNRPTDQVDSGYDFKVCRTSNNNNDEEETQNTYDSEELQVKLDYINKMFLREKRERIIRKQQEELQKH